MKNQTGQAMILVAFILLGVTLFALYLLVNNLGWFNAAQTTRQALLRAAQDGATELARSGSLPLTAVSSPTQPNLPAAAARHCLDPVRARATTLASLAQNLERASTLYVTPEGAPLTAAEVVSDTTGLYLIELKAVNPTALNCPDSDPEPVYPAGGVYPYRQPYVHLAVRLPMKAYFGRFTVSPEYVVDVTSAIDPAGGEK